MRKIGVLLTSLIFLTVSDVSFADVFDKIDNLSTIQKQQLTAIQQEFKKRNDELEKMISVYNNSLIKLRADLDKSKAIIPIGIGVYEKKVQELKSNQDILLKETDKLYKSVLTSEQYKEYQAMQLYVQNAFSNFIQK